MNAPVIDLNTRVRDLEQENADLRSQLTALQAAYSTLMRENQDVAVTLNQWNFIGAAILQDRAEGQGDYNGD